MTDPVLAADAFSPEHFHDTIVRAIGQQGITIPDSHTQMFGTRYDGHEVQAFFAQKINDRWTFDTGVAWHGGRPSLGVELHYSR